MFRIFLLVIVCFLGAFTAQLVPNGWEYVHGFLFGQLAIIVSRIEE